jgi:hypothetical protein
MGTLREGASEELNAPDTVTAHLSCITVSSCFTTVNPTWDLVARWDLPPLSPRDFIGVVRNDEWGVSVVLLTVGLRPGETLTGQWKGGANASPVFVFFGNRG